MSRQERMHFDRDDYSADQAEMNMTPMIDVVFLLIIFFMAAYQLSEAQTSAQVDLPEASQAHPKERKSPSTITIEVVSPGGLTQAYYVVAGQVYLPVDWPAGQKPEANAKSWQELGQFLGDAVGRARAQGEEAPPITLHGDRRVPYRYVQHLMMLCARMGISQFDFEARQVEGGRRHGV